MRFSAERVEYCKGRKFGRYLIWDFFDFDLLGGTKFGIIVGLTGRYHSNGGLIGCCHGNERCYHGDEHSEWY